jgi:hypothetical protein
LGHRGWQRWGERANRKDFAPQGEIKKLKGTANSYSIEADDQPSLSAEIEKDLKCLKWILWHGNGHKALQIVEDLEYACIYPNEG